MTLEEMKAAFLAKNTVTLVDAGVAYGVDPKADKVKRAEARAAKREDERNIARAAWYDHAEERAMEAHNIALMSGAGREAAMDDYNYERNRRR